MLAGGAPVRSRRFRFAAPFMAVALLGANVSDTGAYGLSQVGPGGQGVQPYIEKTLGGIKIAILGSPTTESRTTSSPATSRA
jgi:2',3'-cyclic-nucleotide 2'-phosphodiesterase (5'-nucleotidase family)